MFATSHDSPNPVTTLSNNHELAVTLVANTSAGTPTDASISLKNHPIGRPALHRPLTQGSVRQLDRRGPERQGLGQPRSLRGQRLKTKPLTTQTGLLRDSPLRCSASGCTTALPTPMAPQVRWAESASWWSSVREYLSLWATQAVLNQIHWGTGYFSGLRQPTAMLGSAVATVWTTSAISLAGLARWRRSGRHIGLKRSCAQIVVVAVDEWAEVKVASAGR
jgi:hypothetical protein